MVYVWYTFLSIIIWLARQVGLGVLGLTADAWLVALIIFIWQSKKQQTAIFVFFIVCLLIDLTNFSTWPLYTLTSWLAGAIYVMLIDPLLISGSKWVDFMHVIIFLGLWRMVRLMNLWFASEYGHWSYVSLDWSLNSWFLWFGAGLSFWLVVSWITNKFINSKFYKIWLNYAKRS